MIIFFHEFEEIHPLVSFTYIVSSLTAWKVPCFLSLGTFHFFFFKHGTMPVLLVERLQKFGGVEREEVCLYFFICFLMRKTTKF